MSELEEAAFLPESELSEVVSRGAGVGVRIKGEPRSAELLRAALSGCDVSLERLRTAVKAYVAELRSRQLTPEQSLVAVKEFVGRIPRWAQPVDGTLPCDVTVLDRASTWAIEEYFADSSH